MNTLVLVGVALAAFFATDDASDESGPRAFQDCAVCPRMVALPGGISVIGSPADEPERHKGDVLQQTVSVAAFAVGETEITRAQFQVFVQETKRRIPSRCDTHGDGADTTSDHDPAASWREPRFQQADDHPVVCVTWQDATDYAAWLARKTGRSYRLLDDAEWEYAARAGTASTYFWGDSADLGCTYMNGGDQSLARALRSWQEAVHRDLAAGYQGARLVGCDDGSAFTSTAGSYQPNAFGLYDVTGNAWEWVGNCRDALPDSLAADVAPRTEDSCNNRGVRGGSWDDWPMDLRSADRHKNPPGTRRNDLGFRVARAQQATAF